MNTVPIACHRPHPEHLADFVSLPYDVFDREEASAYVKEHPRSFLGIDRAEAWFGPEVDTYDEQVYEKAGALIRERATDGTLLKDATPCYYLYRLEQDGQAQMGVVCGVAVDDYVEGAVCRHENTRADKELDRINHIKALGAQTGPVFLAYRENPALEALISAASLAQPLYDYVDEYGVRQSVWRIARESATEAMQAALASVERAYVADGHHRAAAAVNASLERREAEKAAGSYDPSDAYNYFLAVLFPAKELKLLAYNRVVYDRFGKSVQELLDAVHEAGFAVGEGTEEPYEPAAPHEFGMYVGGLWHKLEFVGELSGEGADPTELLDVTILQKRVLQPLLGIDDPRRSKRIRYVGGIAGTAELERRATEEGVAFALYPTSMESLMDVSDAGLLMPPKSTWFEPKLRSGLFIRRI